MVALSGGVFKDVEESVTGAKKALDDEFEAWQMEVHAIEEPLKLEHVERSLADYFVGDPPFRSVKSRQDLPDSLIWRSILDIGQQHGTLHFVAKDGGFHNASKQAGPVVVHHDLDAFIQLPECQEALQRLPSEAQYRSLARLKELLPSTKEYLSEVVYTYLQIALDGREVVDRRIPDDNHQGLVIFVGDSKDLEFDFDGAELYGEDEIGFPFEVQTTCTLNYAIVKSDFGLLDEDKVERISINERSDHYYDADEDYQFRVTGLLTLKLDGEKLERKNLDEEDLIGLVLDANTNLEIQKFEIDEYDE